MERGKAVRVVVAEDSEAGIELWRRLAGDLEQALAPAALSVTEARNAAELLGLLKTAERQLRRPELIVLDLNLPLQAGIGQPAGGGALPETAKVGVWAAKRIRRDGNRSSKLVLWTNNVLANELNDAYAFRTLEVDGRPIGDCVIDKAAPYAVQLSTLAGLLDPDAPAAPGWEPPARLGIAAEEALPYLEAGWPDARIAQACFKSSRTVEDWKSTLYERLCPDEKGSDHDGKDSEHDGKDSEHDGKDNEHAQNVKKHGLGVAIVAAARRERVPWLPLHYEDDTRDPLARARA